MKITSIIDQPELYMSPLTICQEIPLPKQCKMIVPSSVYWCCMLLFTSTNHQTSQRYLLRRQPTLPSVLYNHVNLGSVPHLFLR